jgi:hypothetical protein
MLSAILFIFYFIALLIILNALLRKKQISISYPAITFIYAFKVLMGCTYGYIFLKFYRGDDTWMYHRESLLEYQKLFHHPIDFIKDFLPYSAFNASHNFWQGMQYYIQDLEYWLMSKLLALFNIFSRGNYYINVLFFDFISIIGLLLLYKLLLSLFQSKKKLLIAVLFFLPLTTFWLSGIRAEGLLLLCIAAILYYSNKWFNNKQKFIYLIYVLSGLIGCLILRGQLLIVLLPAFFCLTIAWRNPKRAIYYFSAVYLFCIAVFFGSMFFSTQKNLSMPVIKRQQEFFRLHANTSFKLDSLQPSATSFIKILPQAFSNTSLRPFIWEAKGFLQILTSVDIIFFWALLLIAIFFHEKKWKETLLNPLILFLGFVSTSQIILIGYIVPFPGAIVRYKSIAELFLFLLIISFADWDRIFPILNKKEEK